MRPVPEEPDAEPAIGVHEVTRLSGLPAYVIERLTREHRLTHLQLPGMGVYYYWREVRRELEAFKVPAAPRAYQIKL